MLKVTHVHSIKVIKAEKKKIGLLIMAQVTACAVTQWVRHLRAGLPRLLF